jgi:hypothetical protein
VGSPGKWKLPHQLAQLFQGVNTVNEHTAKQGQWQARQGGWRRQPLAGRESYSTSILEHTEEEPQAAAAELPNACARQGHLATSSPMQPLHIVNPSDAQQTEHTAVPSMSRHQNWSTNECHKHLPSSTTSAN